MKIQDLFSFKLLDEMLTEGYVRFRHHPVFPFNIYNYTEKAAYEGVWNEVTKNCRGLIVDRRTDNILARPFPKFMNYGQPGAAEIALDEAVQVTDKMDGSLGILYPTPDGWAIATRGSFESDQAIHATKLLRDKYPNFDPYDGDQITYLFEIIFPENRIVLNYGDLDDLVLLGGVSKSTGHIYGPDQRILDDWKGPRTEVFNYSTFLEALESEPRVNAEGLVVRSLHNDALLKIKQADYISLHRIVTNLSEKSVWEQIQKGDKEFQDFVASLPDEFHEWASKVYGELMDEYYNINMTAYELYYQILLHYGLVEWEDIKPGTRKMPRKDFAQQAVLADKEIRPYIFKIYDGQSFDDLLWQKLKPSGPVGTESRSEDVT